MKLLFDLFPVILFFASFKYAEKSPQIAVEFLSSVGITDLIESQAPILLATLVVILATIAQISWVWWRHKKVDKTLWISLILVVVLGGMTLVLRDDNFIKWKPTLLYWIMGAVLLVSVTLLRKNPLGSFLGDKIELPPAVWNKLNLLWGGFFMGLGALNLFVANTYSTDTWVNFKLFGVTGLIFIFILAQGFFIAPYLKNAENTDNTDNNKDST